MSNQAPYELQDDSPELTETKVAAFRYIMEGDALDSIYDLRGISVFGVIAALRENNDLLYGDSPVLTPAQAERLAEVEGEVDSAVGQDMHYYPFGDRNAKRRLGNSMIRSIAGEHVLPSYENPRTLNKSSRAGTVRTGRTKAAEAALGEPEERSGQVVIRKYE